MKLKNFYQAYKPLNCISPEVKVKGFAVNSKDVMKGDIFFALRGSRTSGIRYVREALYRGAVAVAVKEGEDRGIALSAPLLRVKDPNMALSRWSAAFYNYPTKKMNITGVTGTNGKTTVSSLIYQILKFRGKAGIIGTPGYSFGKKKGKFTMTTPRSHELQKIFSQMLKDGVKNAVMEVSSHALKLKRVEDVHFSAAVFTNLTRDHLDFHGSFSDYFKSKLHLFKLLKNNRAIINIDDEYGRKIKEMIDFNPATYGIKKKALYRARIKQLTLRGSSFNFFAPGKFNREINIKMAGRYNVYNCLAAMAWAAEKGEDMETLCTVVSEAKPVPGRMEIVLREGPGGRVVVIDYAHTPDALENVLKSLAEMTKGRLISVFGCGGDRDREKRPIMGEIAGKLSDAVFITSDNPRHEDPISIILDIELGVRKTGTDYFVFPGREECIEEAIKFSQDEDCILIAGKGDEEYQIIGNRMIPFSDRLIARKYL